MSEYWRKRAEVLKQAELSKAEKVISDRIASQYRKASQSINDDIEKWLQRFADNNDISMAEARRWISKQELEELKWSVEKYIEIGRANAEFADPRWTKQLENVSARVHISRLEEIKLRMQAHVEQLYMGQAKAISGLGNDIITSAYKTLSGDLGVLSGLKAAEVEKLVLKPWMSDGKTFSDRVWTNKKELIGTLDKNLAQAVIRGDDPLTVTRTIAQRLKVDENKAARLVMTESAAFSEDAIDKCFEDLGVEKIEIVETLDSHVCPLCREMDGMVLDLKDSQPGVTTPPYHPWCRGTKAPYFDDEFTEGEDRWFRGGQITYEKPRSSFVGRRDERDLFAHDALRGSGRSFTVLDERAPDGYSNIDLLMKGEKWEIKSPDGGNARAVEDSLRKAKKQFMKQYQTPYDGTRVVFNGKYYSQDDDWISEEIVKQMKGHRIDKVIQVFKNGDLKEF